MRRSTLLLCLAILALVWLMAADVSQPSLPPWTAEEIAKIDNAAADGLSGVSGSLSYTIGEIERHLHGFERWLGAASVATATHKADVDSMTPFVLTAGNDTWGAWVQIMGSADTLGIAGQVKYDFHRVVVSDVSAGADKDIHRLQVSFGATGDAGIAADTYSEILFLPLKGGDHPPIEIMSRRIDIGTLVWARHWVSAENAPTMDIFFGAHGYEG